jgi:hypothetical protein
VAGAGGLFLVSGEAGIGKTRLAEEVARLPAAGGLQVRWGRCREPRQGTAIPHYWPWIQACRAAGPSFPVGHGEPGGLLDGGTGGPAATAHREAARLLRTAAAGSPEAAGLPAGESTPETGSDRFWLMDTVAGLLQKAAAAQPALIVLDDLQWADDPSLCLLEFLAPELAATPLVVIGVFREPEVLADPVLRSVFGRLARLGRSLPLRGLHPREVEEIVARQFERTLAPAAADHLCTTTGGNPWFVDQVMRLHLSDGRPLPTGGVSGAAPAGGGTVGSPVAGTGGAVDRDGSGKPGGGWVPLRPTVPEAVRSAIRRRLEPLPEETRHLLSAAAGVGSEVPLGTLAAMAALEVRSVLELLAQPAVLQIVAPDDLCRGMLRFRPPIVADALYDDLGPVQRIELRRRAERALTTTVVLEPARRPGGPGTGPRSTATGSRPPGPGRTPAQERGTEGTFRQEGEYWTIAYAGTTVRLKDAKGFRYLAQLLARPLLEVHVADLPLIVGCLTREGGAAPGPDAVPAGLSVRRLGDAGQLLDARAKEAYRRRFEHLQEGLREAQEFNDAERRALIEEEMDALARELAASVGLSGRDRKAASAAERARVNVTRTIRAAIDKIAQGNPPLGVHLAVSIRTGTFCSYSPDPAARPTWHL